MVQGSVDLMQYAPLGFRPTTSGGLDVENAQATRGEHAAFIDYFQTWLAAVWKPNVPTLGTRPLTDGMGIPWQIWVPAYTRGFSLQFLYTGRGTITITSENDAFDSVLTCQGSQLAHTDWSTTEHTITEVHPIVATFTKDSVGGNNEWRAQDAAYDAATTTQWILVSVADEDASNTLAIWDIYITPLPPLPSQEIIS